MKEPKEQLQELGLSIIRLKQILHKDSFEFFQNKYGGGSFDPIEWTYILISSHLGIMFDQLEDMGRLVSQNEGNDLYLNKVNKFERAIKRLAREMTSKELSDCFKFEKDLH